ncbi:MAG: SDR family NAD(P)-dependent oxidoreductase [Microbacterium sp.]
MTHRGTTHRDATDEPGGADELGAARDALRHAEGAPGQTDDAQQRTWLITGAGRGLGRALALAAAEAGDVVVAGVRDLRAAPAHERIIAVLLDVRDRARVREAVANAVEATGRLDVLVNNAGYGLVGMIEEVDEDEAREILDTDLLGALWLSQAAMAHFRPQGTGHIVQISTTGAVGVMPGLGLYNAAKWGLEGFSAALAVEAASSGVRVTIVECGAIDTGWGTTSMRFAAPLPAYDGLRSSVFGTPDIPWPADGTGGGLAPQAAAAAILAYVDAPDGRLRLLVGDDAPDQVAQALSARIADYRRDERYPQVD